jgi:uncharacterized membrane protein
MVCADAATPTLDATTRGGKFFYQRVVVESNHPHQHQLQLCFFLALAGFSFDV